jgi:hypothetical protein
MTRRRVVGALLVVLAVVAVAVGVAVASAGDDDPTAADASPLLDTRWWLVRATDGATEVAVPTGGTKYLGLELRSSADCDAAHEAEGLCASGPQLVGSDACNGVSREVAVEGDTVRLGDGFGVHTAMACSDALHNLLADFFAADAFTYTVEAGALRLRSRPGDVVLTYQAMEGPFGPTDSTIVDEGESGAGAYRLVWEGGGLTLQMAAGSEGGNAGTSGVGSDPGRVNAMRTPVQDGEYMFGIVPATATRVVYEPEGGTPEELEVRDVGDDAFAVVGQFVEAAPDRWELVAYAADGAELHRLRWG